MENRWSDAEAAEFVERYAGRCNADLALRVYTSRLIGRDPALVLHGGGNTSVKTVVKDDLGRDTTVLCVKGSGWDLEQIEPEGLPAVRLEPIQLLRALDSLSDEEMVNAQRVRLLDASAPNPSVETLLHAFLPHEFIDHSHADAILALVDQPDAEKICAERYGDRLAIVPYIMPGFALARLAAEVYEAHPDVEGLLLLQHGLFTFGDSARQSYDRHIAAVEDAESFATKRRYWSERKSMPPIAPLSYTDLAPVLRGLLGESERRYVLEFRAGGAIADFVDDPRLAELSQVGVATPDHVIRTKRVPMLLDVSEGDDVPARVQAALDAYRQDYRGYVERQMSRKGVVVKALDPDPRVILVPRLGMITVGATAKAASIAADIYEHTIEVIRSADAVGSYQALPEGDLFDMEYWSLEQAKLGKSKPRALQGQVVVVTGAASGIGAAVARAFADVGAHLYLIDRQLSGLQRLAEELGCPFEILDLTDADAVASSMAKVVQRYGGIDGVVSNAGTAPQGPIDRVAPADLRDSFEVNFFSHQSVAQAICGVLRAQGTGGYLLFNASKAAFNPGAGFGPYAVPKAALVALMKQYALELGAFGIRSNAVNADRIRTQLLDAGDIEERSRARGLTADEYYRANLLSREVTPADVAQAFVHLALAHSTTGSIVTVDGGNIAASPR